MASSIKRGDRRPGATITTNADLSVATTVRLIGALNGTKIIDRPAVLDPLDPSKVVIDVWEVTDTANVGLLRLEVEVVWSDGTKQTFPGKGYLEVEITPDLG